MSVRGCHLGVAWQREGRLQARRQRGALQRCPRQPVPVPDPEPHTIRSPGAPSSLYPPPPQLLRVLDLVNAGLAGPGALAERASDFSKIKRVTTLLEAGLLDVGASLALFLGD